MQTILFRLFLVNSVGHTKGSTISVLGLYCLFSKAIIVYYSLRTAAIHA